MKGANTGHAFLHSGTFRTFFILLWVHTFSLSGDSYFGPWDSYGNCLKMASGS